MSSPLSIVILAAGKGSRMKSPTAKVLHQICGREMLYYSIKAAREITDDVIIVVAHQKEAVVSAMEKHFDGLTFVVQDAENFPGTGGAMMGVRPRYDDVLVLNGDMPLITRDSIGKFLSNPADIVMSVIPLENPAGYGRVVIEEDQVRRIVEEKDATPEQKKINTVNAGVYAFKHHVLQNYIPRLSNANAQGEYYLTDVIEMARNDGLAISPLYVLEEESTGVNSTALLSPAEEVMMDRIRRSWMDAGVIMQLPQTIYIEEGVRFEGECTVENGARLFHQADDGPCLGVELGDAVLGRVVHGGQDDLAVVLAAFELADEARNAALDDVVAQEHDETVVAQKVPADLDGVGQAQGVVLGDVGDLDVPAAAVAHCFPDLRGGVAHDNANVVDPGVADGLDDAK